MNEYCLHDIWYIWKIYIAKKGNKYLVWQVDNGIAAPPGESQGGAAIPYQAAIGGYCFLFLFLMSVFDYFDIDFSNVEHTIFCHDTNILNMTSQHRHAWN